ncbi:MAG: cytidylate kinase-like family protein [Angelakisella sp.]|jgi:cytidylate kinase|nr:cytidylate kinase-like family protein [Angelakisella sp.]
MKENLIITISRQYGSGGREIGRRLAERLGIPYYDKELIILAAERSGYARSLFEEADQKASNSMIFSLMRAGSMVNSYDLPLNDKIYLIQSGVIQQVARQGSCVIVGRCADYVLQDRFPCVNVFIHAALQKRMDRAVKVYGLSPDDVQSVLLKTDKRRETYYNYYTGRKFGDARNYTLSLDSLGVGIENAVRVMADYVESWDGD